MNKINSNIYLQYLYLISFLSLFLISLLVIHQYFLGSVVYCDCSDSFNSNMMQSFNLDEETSRNNNMDVGCSDVFKSYKDSVRCRLF